MNTSHQEKTNHKYCDYWNCYVVCQETSPIIVQQHNGHPVKFNIAELNGKLKYKHQPLASVASDNSDAQTLLVGTVCLWMQIKHRKTATPHENTISINRHRPNFNGTAPWIRSPS